MHTTMQPLLLLFIFTAISIPAITADVAATSMPSFPAIPQPHEFYTPSPLANILSSLGFQDLSNAATEANISTPTPTTIFATSDSSLLTCPTCSTSLLLQEHSLPGLYPLHYLKSLAFGTKIETLAPNRCLTITSSFSNTNTATKKVFVNGVEITKPDIFNNGVIIIHGLQGFISHLSPISCSIERMTTLSYPTQTLPTPSFVVMRHMLKDAMMRLRTSGYSVLALAMRVKYGDLSELKELTVFALDDGSIFAGGIGHSYVADLGFHIVPNRLLMGSDLVGLPPWTALPTMKRGKNLVVTTAGGGGPLAPMRINYVKIKSFDLLRNSRIVVHGLSMPFPHVEHLTVENDYENIEPLRSEFSGDGGFFGMMAPVAGMRGTVDVEDYHGL